MLHLFWKRDGATGCYTKYLERGPLEGKEGVLIHHSIATACECLIIWQPLPKDSPLYTFPFWQGHIFHPAYSRYRRLLEKIRPFDCQCPDVDLICSKADVTATIFCLNRHLQISSRVSHHPYDVTRAHYFLLSGHIKIFWRELSHIFSSNMDPLSAIEEIIGHIDTVAAFMCGNTIPCELAIDCFNACNGLKNLL